MLVPKLLCLSRGMSHYFSEHEYEPFASSLYLRRLRRCQMNDVLSQGFGVLDSRRLVGPTICALPAALRG